MKGEHPSRTSGAVLLLAVATLTWYAWVAATQSYFFSDEMASLYALRMAGPEAFIVEPLNVQLVPLHRMATWLLHGAFGVHFETHVAVMWVLALGYLWLLWRVVLRLSESRSMAALVVLFAASYGMFGASLLWFSSALHRLPYLIATLAAFELWIVLRLKRPGLAALGVAALTLCAEGFYAKGVLLPFHVVALELCLLAAAAKVRRLSAPAVQADAQEATLCSRPAVYLVPSLVFAVGLALLAQRGAHAELGMEGAKWWSVVAAAAWRVMGASLVGGVRPEAFAALPSAWAVTAGVGILAALVAVTTVRGPRNAVVWLVLFVCALANGLVLVVSNRGSIWGPLVAVSYRYYIDIVMVVLPMAAIALSDLPRPARSNQRAIGVGAIAVLLVALQVPSFLHLVDNDLGGHVRTRRIIDRLLEEVHRVQGGQPPMLPSVQDELLPQPLVEFPGQYSSVRHLFLVLDLPLPVVAEGDLVMEADGRLVPKPASYRVERRIEARRQRGKLLKDAVIERWRQLL